MVCAKSLKGQPIEALDGLIGHVDDLYFDDSAWKVRYLVVKTGNWLFGRKVLIVPDALAEQWHGESGVPVNLTKHEIRSSPDIDTARPISRDAEQLLHHHYGWLPYWSIGAAPPPTSDVGRGLEQRLEAPSVPTELADSHLCCVKDVLGYKLCAKDGEAGQLADVVIHENDAEVWYVAVHLPKTLHAKTVLIRTCNVSGFDWVKKILISPLSCHEIEASPAYESAA
jgi:uncharacterized protein YrrD